MAVLRVPKNTKSPSLHWHEGGEADANESECLLLGFAVVLNATGVRELNDWATEVYKESEDALERTAGWKPADSWGLRNGVSKILAEAMRP